MSAITQKLQPTPSDSSRRLSFMASASSIITAFIASICCVGPLVLALLGIGGAGLITAFVPYRPYFLAATIALLAAGFYLTYRTPRVSTAPGDNGQECACPAPRASRAGKIMLWTATILVVAFLAFPYLVPVLFE